MKNLDSIFTLRIWNFWWKYQHIFSQEILWVISGFKNITKLEPFRLSDVEIIEKVCKKFWLVYIYFPLEKIFDEQNMQFISRKTSQNNDPYIDMYVSKKEKYTTVLQELYNIPPSVKRNIIIGKMLWYPECCIESFLNKNYTNDFDYNKRSMEQSDWYYWQLNNLINPYSLIPFFPCKYNCSNALTYAKKNLSLQKYTDEVEYIFSSQVTYFWFRDIYLEKNGVFYQKNYQTYSVLQEGSRYDLEKRKSQNPYFEILF